MKIPLILTKLHVESIEHEINKKVSIGSKTFFNK